MVWSRVYHDGAVMAAGERAWAQDRDASCSFCNSTKEPEHDQEMRLDLEAL